MNNVCIEKRLLKYIPKRMREYVVWLDFESSSHVYFLTFGINGKEVNAEQSDTVDELRYNASQCWPELKELIESEVTA